MLTRNRGHIVTLTSIFGLFPCANRARLSADAHATIALMESLRLDLKQTNIKTTTVCLSAVKTSKECLQNGSWMFPEIDSEICIRNIIAAVETSQDLVLLPKFLHLMMFVRNVTPKRFSDRLFENETAYREIESQ